MMPAGMPINPDTTLVLGYSIIKTSLGILGSKEG